jgi:sugar lactone lactonase YvrE
MGRAQSEMQYPCAVAIGSEGELYVADRNLPGIWRVKNGELTIYFQAAKQFRTPLNAVRSLAVDADGVLYAGDSSTRDVYRFDADAKPRPLTQGTIGNPTALAFDKAGNLFVADLELRKIFRVPKGADLKEEWVDTPAPRGLCFDSEGGLWVIANSKQPIVRYDSDRKPEIVLKESPFEFPNQMTIDENGNAFVCDGYAKTVWKVTRQGNTEAVFRGPPFSNPVGIAYRAERLWIADPHQRMVYSLGLDPSKTPEPIIKP